MILINDCLNMDDTPTSARPSPSLRDLLEDAGIGDVELLQLIDDDIIAADSMDILSDPLCCRALDGPVGASTFSSGFQWF